MIALLNSLKEYTTTTSISAWYLSYYYKLTIRLLRIARYY
jgi:hypothetical protein